MSGSRPRAGLLVGGPFHLPKWLFGATRGAGSYASNESPTATTIGNPHSPDAQVVTAGLLGGLARAGAGGRGVRGRSEAPKGHFGQQEGASEVLWHLCGTCAVELVFAGVACGGSMQGGCSPQQMLLCWSLQHNIYCACTSSGSELRTQAIVRLAIARGAWKWRWSPRPELCSCGWH